MALVKNVFLFGGWLPALLGGAGGVWWMSTDKTVEDALKRTGLTFLSSKEDFERVYDEFEYDDNLFKDIPDVKEQRGKAISKWCRETMQESLTRIDAKELVSEATRYCMGSKKVASGARDFRKFDNILNLLEESKLKPESMGGFVMALIGTEKNEDVYYSLNSEDDLTKDAWRIDTTTNKDRAFATRLFIDDEHEILDISGNKHYHLWNERAIKYDEEVSEKFPDLAKAKTQLIGNARHGDGITHINQLRNHCGLTLRKWIKDKAELEKTKKLFIKWCTQKANKR